MIAAADVPIFLSLLATGFLGSVHCIGMCGPLLLAFDGFLVGPDGGRSGRLKGFVAYHAGRLWTYGVLGMLAGGLGAAMHDRFDALDWQRPLAIVLAATVVLVGLALLGVFPRIRIATRSQTCLPSAGGRQWLDSLMRQRAFTARLLLGTIVGLIPCGLVYAALLVATGLGSPMAGAVGMLCFGLGTLPALSGVVLAGRLGPVWLRAGGQRWAAAFLVGAGLIMLARVLWFPMHG